MGHSALIVWGGWEGHEPKPVAEIIAGVLKSYDFDVEVSDTLDAFLDADRLKTLDLIVPVWTMGKITGDQVNSVAACRTERRRYRGMPRRHVRLVPGCHRMALHHRRAVGIPPRKLRRHLSGEHPPNRTTSLQPERATSWSHRNSTICTQIPPTRCSPRLPFPQPGADGPHVTNGPVAMPVVWTKMYGDGRVFYSSLGHNAGTVKEADPLRLLTRGMLWAAKAESAA